MRLLAVIMLAACAGSAPPVAKPIACPPAPVVAAAPALDDAQLRTRATAFLLAMSARDVTVLETQTTGAYLNFVYGRTYDRKTLLTRFAGASTQPVKPERSCDRVQTRISATSAIYTAECNDKYAARDDMPAYEALGLYSVVFAVEDAVWKVAYTSYQTAGVESERDMWNDTFQRGTGFRKEANQHLMDTVKGKKPGKALDIAMGQGRNVLYLAAQGWKVTGVDISDAGIKLAKVAADKQKVTFEGVTVDIDKYDLGTAKWDLVTLIYAGTDPKLIERVQKGLKKGGLFVVEFFHKDAVAGVGIGGFTTGELAKQFGAGWTIVKDEVIEDIADWGLRKTKLVRFVAQKN